MKLRVGLLGGGSWGTTVASLVSRNAPIKLWARDAETVDDINSNHRNSKYLPDSVLPRELKATGDLGEAVADADVLVMGIPSSNFRAVLEEAKQYLRPWVPVISLTKGLELSTGKRMTQVIEDVLPGHPVGVLTGPNLAREIMAGQAAASVISMEDEIIVKQLQQLFHSGLFRVYTNTDLLGCELGGVLKNIIAIAVGMGDGLGAGDNTRSALITRGLAEITRLGVAMGGRPETFAGLTGMGDMIATCTSPLSRNRHVGVELGKGRKIDEIIDDMLMVAEGVKSAPTVMALAKEHGVAMPIAEDVFEVTKGNRSAVQAYRGLIRASAGAESDAG
ncbi:glycerol 3-phosphate dehydrogenase (NAD(P)+) [Parasphingorhabdus marina DSM 22363]|uniref:Glycerol-3-phosphate dehydrogenase [NAD(P)+] n=1 Tax=Parasphingorhabdus marina DSM 22363 TaxID=1123272 RepID=A0A1N6G4L7_9SPHN|nr:NAD(P)H-dependent glycerol-3-phosphate dehydrogenase [Parasphingorhabdus marina]SIO02362.1 glycerol 3-phosphate dehydrogenase (NAD(P)+) [Parasphingorhabdus marina DSM 22363]